MAHRRVPALCRPLPMFPDRPIDRTSRLLLAALLLLALARLASLAF